MMQANVVSGKLLDLDNFKLGDIDLLDIAMGLSNICRYNGQVIRFYSVAEHCVLLTRYAQEKGHNEHFQRAVLMHDAAEAYVGDVIRGVKKNLKEFNDLERKIINKIFTRFEIVFAFDNPTLATLDTNICKDEMWQLQRITDKGLAEWVLSQPQLGIKIQGWTPEQARKQFLIECERLEIQ